MANWTKEQEEAIDARNSNLLVAAAAGSGKTTVLVERIIQLVINDRIDIDRMLIVTFTQAAAGEMRERINAALFKEMEKGREDEHLRRQLYLLNRSSISTLHAFCTDVVRQHFHLVNVDPHFRIADSTEAELIKMEALEELLDQEYEKGDNAFLELVEAFGGSKDDKPLEALILRLYSFIQSHPEPLRWLREKIANLALGEDNWAENPWARELSQQIKIELYAAQDILKRALYLCGKASGPQGYGEAIENDQQWVELMLEALDQGLPALYSCQQQHTFKRLGRVSRDADENLKSQVKTLREEGKKIITGIHSLLGRDPAEYLQDLNEVHPIMNYLGEILEAFGGIYREKKREKGVVDFNDLEHLALQILSNETVAREYREYYSYIFVDEYQDSNLVQETILNYFKREDNLFMVGDVKQSIYRFRLADPSLFLEKQNSYPLQEGSVNRRVDLNKNFRSHPEILNAINYIFRHLMSRELGEIDYDEKSYLYPGFKQEELKCEVIDLSRKEEKQEEDSSKRVELYILENNPELIMKLEENETDELQIPGEAENEFIERIIEMDNTEMEALLIAQKIRHLLEEDIYDPQLDAIRKTEYRDIVILLRATRNSAGIYMEQLSAEGIPVYADASSGYFDTLELNLFINLLRLIDNKRQDIALLSVMRSPIGGFSIGDFIKIRTSCFPRGKNQSFSFYEAMESYMAEHNDGLKDRLSLFLQQIREWQLESRIMALDEFIWKLFMDTGYYYYAGAMPGGVQRQANLRILLHRAREFQKSSFKGLFSFIKYIEKIKSSGSDMGNACIIGENDNVVRLMSIHKSKGLEFPVVILGGLGRAFNIRDSNENVLLHRELGIGPRYVNAHLRTYRDSIARLAIKNRIKLENLAEEMRILYVACTRPQEKLIMVGTTRKLESAWRRWSQEVNSFNQSRARTFLDWLIPIIMRHEEEGQYLRESAGGDWDREILWADESRWRVKLINPLQLTAEEVRKEEVKHEWESLLEQGGYPHPTAENEEIRNRLNWKYPYREAEKIPAKLSVSQISQISAGVLEETAAATFLTRAPVFLSRREGPEQRFSAAEKGSIVHLVMQNLDYGRVELPVNLEEQLGEMVERELLTPSQLTLLEVKKIWQFFQSSLGQRLLKSNRFFREAPFNLLAPANDIFTSAEICQEKLLIQGIIDLYFYEGEDIVLLDFKTDIVHHKSKDEMLDPYRLQIELYKKALERITGSRVKESYIYFFDLDREIRI
ncbi:MAG: UvrD-helicase domain-containing protein [Syntrophomonas sp.]|uniref:UvrD-helicase domain-containing protein n=1 Tax=Syntrophomonas sp. TaxID=2053627 RepID=UPI002627CF52|nr:UvrD-helicase domain-containing protein [Syntrophomonas sp.]MDD2509765.1 UvrD-helicase domain-containing protein [Syntrophomonas sp.]MDD4625742.1 UvrD-helicase domain-containing protein [Syntrophomonas sp.]